MCFNDTVLSSWHGILTFFAETWWLMLSQHDLAVFRWAPDDATECSTVFSLQGGGQVTAEGSPRPSGLRVPLRSWSGSCKALRCDRVIILNKPGVLISWWCSRVGSCWFHALDATDALFWNRCVFPLRILSRSDDEKAPPPLLRVTTWLDTSHLRNEQ